MNDLPGTLVGEPVVVPVYVPPVMSEPLITSMGMLTSGSGGFEAKLGNWSAEKKLTNVNPPIRATR